jgi:hypothetical protein
MLIVDVVVMLLSRSNKVIVAASLSSNEGFAKAYPLKPGVRSNEGIVAALSSNEGVVVAAASPKKPGVQSNKGIVAAQRCHGCLSVEAWRQVK